MVVHPSSSYPPQQWHLASPEGPDLLLGSLCSGVLLLSPWHTAPLPMINCSLAPNAVSHHQTQSSAKDLVQSLSLIAQPSPKHLIL